MSRWLAPLLVLLVWSPAARAQQPRLEWERAPAGAPMLTLGLKPADALFPIGLAHTRISPLALRPRFDDWLGEWESGVRERLATSRRLANGTLAESASPDSVAFLPPPPIKLAKAASDTAEGAGGILGGTLGEYADIGMLVHGRGELGGQWQRYKPCDPGLQITCNPSLFPQLKPDVQFGVRVGGTISERIHVNVDYDEAREFDAANNLNVYYQGFEDEILQRLEVGDVSIRLPSSRYLTQGIPAGNFGFKATGQLGPIDFQTVWAQQRGDVTTREFRLAGGGSTQGLVQDEVLSVDDADYVKGQFFLLLDPDLLAGAPHIDVLTLRAADAPESQRPSTGSIIEVYRDERPSALNQQQQAQLGYFLADAVMPDGSRTHRGLFKRLQQDRDYVLHASGLWIMLRAPLRTDEALAVSYITENGDTIGTVNAESTPVGTTPSLRLIRGPAAIHQPNFPTWKYELHNVYRVHASSTVEASSIEMTVSLGQATSGRTFVNTSAGQLPYISLFGLDEDAPTDVLDLAQIYQPAQDFGGIGSAQGASSTPRIGGTFVVLPTLRPFFEPGPVGTARLTAAEAKLALGNDANRVIYEDVDPINRDGAARFRLNFKYRVRVEGLVSSFNLGALGIREESERITIGTRELQRGVDYNIDYDIGLVTLTDAQGLFATNPGSELRAKWEQKSQFQLAPTSVFGMNARYSLGPRGELNFVGLYQNEKTIMTRPQLGVEPSSIFLGGTSGRLDLGGALLDRALAKLPGLRLTGESSVMLNGEAAFSMPNPNTRNEAYVDDFEAAEGLGVDLRRRLWRLGSRPDFLDGASEYLPGTLDVSNAAQLIWQHDVLQDGKETGGELPQNIDKQIQIAGTALRDQTMWVTLGANARPLTGRRWRSMTSVLSTTAIDLSRSEYLEFYVRTSEGTGKALIFDIGTVGEDAFYFDNQGNTSGTYPGGRSWGLGVLDEEARLAQREIWSPELDALGLYNESCTGSGIQVPPLGDISANCARGNGLVDTEDLDGNGVPDLNDGPHFRYVVPLDALSPYLVRDRSQTGTLYQLYRVPLRDGIPINGATTATWRFIKHLRMTATSATSQPVDQLVLARMRIIGSRWVKRDLDGVSRGMFSAEKGLSAGIATVQVAPVSRLTNGAEYASPPLVREQLQDPSQGIGASSQEFNEKGLSIKYSALGADERADVYFRYAQQPRSFLSYRQMQLWAVARSGEFGPAGDQRLFVKVGTDARNYYFYQTRLHPAVAGGTVTPNDWLPQLTIDFEQWFELKAKAELALLNGELPPATGEPYVVFSADSTYGIVFEDRARGPNLAAVRELSFGVYNGSTDDAAGEVWINDIRLGAAFRDAGVAGNIALDIRGGDFLAAHVSFANQGAVFRQLNQDASYLGAGELNISTTAQLGQLMPASWGIEMPVTVSHAASSQDPTLLEASDVQAARLPGLREVGSSATRIGMSLRKRTPSSNPLVSALVDGLILRLGYNKGDNSSITLRNEASGFDGALTYQRVIKPHSIDIVPGFIEAALRLLVPAAIEDSDFFKRLTASRLRYTPARLAFSTSYFGQERRAYQFSRILVSDSDNVVVPIESPRRTLDADASLNFQLFSSLGADVTLRTSRDLLPSHRATIRAPERDAMQDARSRLAGFDVGWETNRSLTSRFDYKPVLTSWLKPSASLTTRFGTDRSPSYLEIITVGADTTAILQRRFQADRVLRRQLEFAPYGLYQSLVDDTTGFAGFLGRTLRALQQINFAWSGTLGSQFDRKLVDPGIGYQFALGDLQSFRVIGLDSAAAATETGRFEATTGIRVARVAQFDVLYSKSDLQAFDQRGGSRREHEETWPNLRFSWADMPVPGFLRGGIRQLSLTGSYQQKSRQQALGFATSADRGNTETLVPFSARLTLAGGIAAIYSGSWSRGKSDDPTGDAEQNGMNHSINLSATFRPPESLGEKLREPIRANVSLTQNQQMQCRFRTLQSSADEQISCVSFLDYRHRTLNLTLDTNVSDLVVGVQLGYTSRQDFVGTRRGNSQFQLGVFANFELPVGQLPGGTIRGGGGIQ